MWYQDSRKQSQGFKTDFFLEKRPVEEKAYGFASKPRVWMWIVEENQRDECHPDKKEPLVLQSGKS